MYPLLFHSSVLLDLNRICAVVIFHPKKVVVTVLAVFLSFGFTNRHYLSFHKFEKQSCLFAVHNALFTCQWSLEVLSFFISVFFCEIMAFCLSISDAVFLVTSYSIFDHSVWLILSFRCAIFYSSIQFYWGSGRCTSESALECFCLKKVVTYWSFPLASGY